MRRGLLNEDDAENARWHASVQMLLAREIEDRESPATIPAAFFEELFQRRRVEFRHDGLVTVIHALATVEADAGVVARDAAAAKIAAFRERLLSTAGAKPTRSATWTPYDVTKGCESGAASESDHAAPTKARSKLVPSGA